MLYLHQLLPFQYLEERKVKTRLTRRFLYLALIIQCLSHTGAAICTICVDATCIHAFNSCKVATMLAGRYYRFGMQQNIKMYKVTQS